MNHVPHVLIGLMLVTLCIWPMPSSAAQRGMNMNAQMPKYDVKTEVTVKGTIKEVQHMTPATTPRGRGRMSGMDGTHIKIETDKGPVDVHLGPSRYLAEKKFTVNQGDAVEITGSMVKIAGSDALIAREITKGNEKLVLRDSKGIPLWSGSQFR